MFNRTDCTQKGRYGLLILILLGIDVLTKQIVLHHFAYAEHRVVWPFLSWVRWHNTGAAFGFLHEHAGWQQVFFISVAILSIALFGKWLIDQKPQQTMMSLALSFFIAGAAGNLIDRLCYGYVVDFILLHWGANYFPAFNVADCLINFGLVLYIGSYFKNKALKNGS